MTAAFEIPERAQQLEDKLKPHLQRVAKHEVWHKIKTVEHLRVFMQHHVFCVWDFMTLLKRLQGGLTGMQLPWSPVGDPKFRRLINEITLCEETDHLPDGRVASHYELYLKAMEQIGADTSVVERVVASIRSLSEWPAVADTYGVPVASREFVQTTFNLSQMDLHIVVAAFAIGREEAIPAMFIESLAGLAESEVPCDLFQEYLQRHIDIDGDEHGPMGLLLLAGLCGDDADKWREAEKAAISALQARARLWDAIAAQLN